MSDKIDRVIEIFEDICRIPRCSKNELMISNWLVNWAKEHRFEVKQDEVLNVLMKIPATEGLENAQTLVLQGHMDMVCVKSEKSEHDFSKDAVKIVRIGDWINADNTTLGADNGIAVALALAIAEDKTLKHPQLELLFTVDEETGLTGASMLDTDFVTGKVLINIDSEDEGVFTVGCAGGMNLKIEMMTESTEILNVDFIKIKTGGMLGGHSGIEIHKPRANAIKILTKILLHISENHSLNIVSIAGGIAHNAIPSNAEAIISVKKTDLLSILDEIKNIGNLLILEHSDIEKDFYVKADKIDITSEITTCYNDITTGRLIQFLSKIKHGVIKMSEEVDGAVETSCNLAKIETNSDTIVITSSLRSNKDNEIGKLKDKIAKIASQHGATLIASGQYPSWQPNMQSKLLSKCTETYEKIFKKSPKIEVIHAGLECGIIGAKYDGMDMISIGPTIQHPHTPEERLNIPSLERIWVLLSKLLQSYT